MVQFLLYPLFYYITKPRIFSDYICINSSAVKIASGGRLHLSIKKNIDMVLSRGTRKDQDKKEKKTVQGCEQPSLRPVFKALGESCTYISTFADFRENTNST